MIVKHLQLIILSLSLWMCFPHLWSNPNDNTKKQAPATHSHCTGSICQKVFCHCSLAHARDLSLQCALQTDTEHTWYQSDGEHTTFFHHAVHREVRGWEWLLRTGLWITAWTEKDICSLFFLPLRSNLFLSLTFSLLPAYYFLFPFSISSTYPPVSVACSLLPPSHWCLTPFNFLLSLPPPPPFLTPHTLTWCKH